MKEFGRIDILVSNAGIQTVAVSPDSSQALAGGDARGDFAPHAAEKHGLVQHQDAVGAPHAGHDRLDIERHDGARREQAVGVVQRMDSENEFGFPRLGGRAEFRGVGRAAGPAAG